MVLKRFAIILTFIFSSVAFAQSGNQTIGPLNTQAINYQQRVGVGNWSLGSTPTQNAVNAACNSNGGYGSVLIEQGATPSDGPTIGGTGSYIINGCANVTILDQRGTAGASCYKYSNSTTYVQGACATAGDTPACPTCVVTNPTVTQNIVQPSGTSASIKGVKLRTGLLGPPNVYLVGAGDSRMSGSSGTANEDPLTQISLTPQFSGNIAGMHNGAIPGATCASMTSGYAANVYPYRPSAVGADYSYLFIEDLFNDVNSGVSFNTWSTCYRAYLNTAVADGFTPVILTGYYSSAYSAGAAGSPAFDTADDQRQQSNIWLLSLPYLSVNLDNVFPPSASNPWYGFASGAAATITGYSITSGVGTFTATNSWTIGESVYIGGYLTASDGCVNNTTVTVLSTGLSGAQFEANVNCPNLTSSNTGYSQNIAGDTTHLSPAGNVLLAQYVNDNWGIAKSGTTSAWNPNENYFNSPAKNSIFAGNGIFTGAGGYTPIYLNGCVNLANGACIRSVADYLIEDVFGPNSSTVGTFQFNLKTSDGSTIIPFTFTSTTSTLPGGLSAVGGNFTVSSGNPFTYNISGGVPPTPPAGTTIYAPSNAANRITSTAVGATPFFTTAAYAGTYTSLSAVTSGTQIGGYNAWAYNGTSLNGPIAAFRAYANQNQTGSNGGSYADVAVTPNGSLTEAESMRWENDGGVTMPSTVTGGDKGAGTLNAAGLYVNGVAVGTGSGTVTSIATTGPIGGGTITATGTITCTTCLTATSPTAHGVMLGEGSQALTPTAAGTSGYFLQALGASTDPAWFNLFGTANTFTAGQTISAGGAVSGAFTSTGNNAAITVQSSGGSASSGPAVIAETITQAAGSGTYVYGTTAFAPNISTGAHVLMLFGGLGNSTANAGYLGFKYVGSASSANNYGVGFAGGSGQLFAVQAGGGVTVGNAETTSTLPGLFNVGATNQFQVSTAGAIVTPSIAINGGTAITAQSGTGGTVVMTASPALTGSPTAPTQSALDNSTKIATTAYTDAAVAAYTASCGGGMTSGNIAAGAGAGTSPSLVQIQGFDCGHNVSITTGTLPTGSGAIVATITLNTPRHSGFCTFAPASPASALLSGATMIYLSTITSSQYILYSGTTGLVAATAYSWNVSCP